ncbi:alkaline phosphatase family protein [Jiulongibacter sediminis]|uniref:alkaline phosphatase family protein n=1 Tax=Jiulongibacter sediminis TaxID=1605367 RepID=UPI0026EA3B6C|nr:alkaline phosphatase family protein [Jiulongibacter sediminis]
MKAFLSLIFLFFLSSGVQAQSSENLVLITLDGFRWQELFRGASEELILTEPENEKANSEKFRYREKLMPFMWGVIASEGFIAGNQDCGSIVRVHNRFGFSYPGYNELLTGKRDLRIHSNRKKWNPNRNVLEVINSEEQYKGKVSVHSTWDAMPYIINAKRSEIKVYSSQQDEHKRKERKGLFTNDSLTYVSALASLKKNESKVVYISFDATDEKAHRAEYGNYLEAANRIDKYIESLWAYCQSDSNYKDKTTFLITTDHGRGYSKKWSEHGLLVSGSKNIWLAGIGPAVIKAGEMENEKPLYQNQIAAALLNVLGIKKKLPKTAGKSPKRLLSAR